MLLALHVFSCPSYHLFLALGHTAYDIYPIKRKKVNNNIYKGAALAYIKQICKEVYIYASRQFGIFINGADEFY